MYKDHARFEPPEDPTIPLWRYVDFAKFVSPLHRKALFFPNAASLGDAYEGSYPIANIRLRPLWYGEHAPTIETQFRPEALRRLQSTLISCWHMNRGESAAMWRLYAGQGYGIAIRSSYARLRESFDLPQPLYIGVVKYLTYETDPMPEGNLFDPFLHKRTSFAHENELRAVTERNVPPGTSTQWNVADGPPPYFGDYITARLDTMVEAIVVSPASPRWYLDAVGATAAQFGLKAVVQPSELDTPPSY